MTLIQYRVTCSISSGRVGRCCHVSQASPGPMIGRPGWSLVRGACGHSFRARCFCDRRRGSGSYPRPRLQPRFARWGCSVPLASRPEGGRRGVLEGVSRGAPHDRPGLFSGPHLLRRRRSRPDRDRGRRCGPCPAFLEPLPCLTGTPSTPLSARRAVLPSDDSRRCFNRAPSRWCRRKTYKGRPGYEQGPPRGVSS